jgi:large subunit ribosomal protein L7/L12
MADDRLEKLKARKQVIEDQIKQIENRKNAEKRKTENRRKFLAGAFALSEAEKSEDYKKALYQGLGRFLTRKEDRALFNLPPLPDKNDDKQDGKTSG